MIGLGIQRVEIDVAHSIPLKNHKRLAKQLFTIDLAELPIGGSQSYASDTM